jgi:hypothetical protein
MYIEKFGAAPASNIPAAVVAGPLWETIDAARQDSRIATHRLLHGPEQASHVLAPVVGREGAAQDTTFRAELATGVFPK